MDTRLDFPGIQIFTRSHEEISGVWAADRLCTNEREYPLRLDTSQSSLKWWLAARQEVLSSSKYFLNTTKYYPSLNTPFSPGSWGRHTVHRGRRGQQSAPCCLVTPGTDITPVTHAAGPRLASAGTRPRSHDPHTPVELRPPSRAGSDRVLTSDIRAALRDIGNPSEVHMRLREATARVNCELELLHITL